MRIGPAIIVAGLLALSSCSQSESSDVDDAPASDSLPAVDSEDQDDFTPSDSDGGDANDPATTDGDSDDATPGTDDSSASGTTPSTEAPSSDSVPTSDAPVSTSGDTDPDAPITTSSAPGGGNSTTEPATTDPDSRPASTDPDAGDPGTTDPDPGTTDPDAGDPATTDPGNQPGDDGFPPTDEPWADSPLASIAPSPSAFGPGWEYSSGRILDAEPSDPDDNIEGCDVEAPPTLAGFEVDYSSDFDEASLTVGDGSSNDARAYVTAFRDITTCDLSDAGIGFTSFDLLDIEIDGATDSVVVTADADEDFIDGEFTIGAANFDGLLISIFVFAEPGGGLTGDEVAGLIESIYANR